MVLPADVRPYRRTEEFTEATVPRALLKAHATKDGTWALIHVLAGSVAYRIEDPRRLASRKVLTPLAAPGVIEPTVLHAVTPLDQARFYLEFYRREGA